MVDRLASGLRAAGIVAGDRIAILARNSHAFIALRFAIARADAVLVPINFMLNAQDVRYILEHSGARFLFVDRTTIEVAQTASPETLEQMFGIPGESDPAPAGLASWESLLDEAKPPAETRGGDDLLQIVYTSGTESRPQGAMLSHNGRALGVPELHHRLRMDRRHGGPSCAGGGEPHEMRPTGICCYPVRRLGCRAGISVLHPMPRAAGARRA